MAKHAVIVFQTLGDSLPRAAILESAEDANSYREFLATHDGRVLFCGMAPTGIFRDGMFCASLDPIEVFTKFPGALEWPTVKEVASKGGDALYPDWKPNLGQSMAKWEQGDDDPQPGSLSWDFYEIGGILHAAPKTPTDEIAWDPDKREWYVPMMGEGERELVQPW